MIDIKEQDIAPTPTLPEKNVPIAVHLLQQ
jgi:hypothetical protein